DHLNPFRRLDENRLIAPAVFSEECDIAARVNRRIEKIGEGVIGITDLVAALGDDFDRAFAFRKQTAPGSRTVVISDKGYFAAVAERRRLVAEPDEIRILDRRRFADEGDQLDAFRAGDENATPVSDTRKERDLVTLVDVRRVVML